MLSRVWLALAFAVAFGASPALAASRPESDLLKVTLDQAKVARLPPGTSTLIIGNPMIADVTMLKSNGSMVITGKGFGRTNLIAIDADGAVLSEQQLVVLPAKSVVVLQSGPSRVSYACDPDCMPAVQLGDDPKTFAEAGGEITSRNGFAAGSAGAGPK